MLKTCSTDGCCPVEQTRGQIGAGDYHDVIAANRIQRFGGVEQPEKYGTPASPDDGASDDQLHVEMNDDIKDDFRICCSKCGKATPWQKSDAPGMPGAGQDFTRKVWNEKTHK